MHARQGRRAAPRHEASVVSARSPLQRPGFIAASVGVSLLILAGLVVSILAASDGAADHAALASASTPDSTTSPAGGAEELEDGRGDGNDGVEVATPSSCGLPDPNPEQAAATGDASTWRLAIAPETSWRDVDVNLAPTLPHAGPAATHDSGFAYCYQRSPEGALSAAANLLVQSNTPGLRGPVLEYALAPGSHRDALLAESAATGDVVRMQIVGYRMLAFDGTTARVDVAQRVTVDGASTFIAAVVELEWVDGDWRIPTHEPRPVRMQALSDVGGYVRWSA